jgi:hypothetical protein
MTRWTAQTRRPCAPAAQLCFPEGEEQEVEDTTGTRSSHLLRRPPRWAREGRRLDSTRSQREEEARIHPRPRPHRLPARARALARPRLLSLFPSPLPHPLQGGSAAPPPTPCAGLPRTSRRSTPSIRDGGAATRLPGTARPAWAAVRARVGRRLWIVRGVTRAHSSASAASLASRTMPRTTPRCIARPLSSCSSGLPRRLPVPAPAAVAGGVTLAPTSTSPFPRPARSWWGRGWRRRPSSQWRRSSACSGPRRSAMLRVRVWALPARGRRRLTAAACPATTSRQEGKGEGEGEGEGKSTSWRPLHRRWRSPAPSASRGPATMPTSARCRPALVTAPTLSPSLSL